MTTKAANKIGSNAKLQNRSRTIKCRKKRVNVLHYSNDKLMISHFRRSSLHTMCRSFCVIYFFGWWYLALGNRLSILCCVIYDSIVFSFHTRHHCQPLRVEQRTKDRGANDSIRNLCAKLEIRSEVFQWNRRLVNERVWRILALALIVTQQRVLAEPFLQALNAVPWATLTRRLVTKRFEIV